MHVVEVSSPTFVRPVLVTTQVERLNESWFIINSSRSQPVYCGVGCVLVDPETRRAVSMQVLLVLSRQVQNM